MKRLAWLGTVSIFALVGVYSLACHPTEPKQASGVDPVGEEGSSGSGGSSSSSTSSSGGSGGNRRDDIIVPPPAGAASGKAGKANAAEPVAVNSLSSVTEGIKWGVSHAEVLKQYTENGGVIWKDYDEKLSKARVGPEMTAIEAEREEAKRAFGRTYVEFKDTPTGYDATGLKGEYTYRNRESILWISRAGKKRHFFFINDRLWKVYDEIPLSEGGPMGKSYIDAVNKMNAQVGAQGRIQGADAAKGVHATTVDWKDGASHLRVVDRSGEHLVAVIVEDNGTLGNLASLRSNKAEDPTAIDPTIAAVTKGGLSDPNAAKAAPSGAASGKKPPTTPPKKK